MAAGVQESIADVDPPSPTSSPPPASARQAAQAVNSTCFNYSL